MMISAINPQGLAPPVDGLYSQVTVVEAGKLAFVSGQVALDAEGKLVGPGDHRRQAEQVFENLKLAVEGIGGRARNIVRMTIYVVRHEESLIGPIFDAGHRVFGDEWPVTASTLLGVETLAMSSWLIEVEAVVALDT